MYQKKYHIHFIGIGGIGMSGIAELLLNLGYRVSGSDLNQSTITQRLEQLGGKIFVGHAPEHVKGADVVVKSSAIRAGNPEIVAAREASIPVIPRAEMLAELMRLKYSIAIAGAHGKTTTTSIVAAVLAQGGLDPTVVIGGKLKSIDTNALLGQGDYIIAEADESDGSFLKFSPTIAVVTNIDREHLDFYSGIEEIKQVFLNFIDRIPFYGQAVLCLDNPYIQDLIPRIEKRYTTYGLTNQADFQARRVAFEGPQATFELYRRETHVGTVRLNLPGIHNVYNALASIAVGHELGISVADITTALEGLQGVQRRMEVKGTARGVVVVDDYGHHPTEIATTLSAIEKSWPLMRKVVVFQPHRYSRTQALFDDFARAFYQADVLLVLPIYAAGEAPLEGVDSRRLSAAIQAHGHKQVVFAADFEAAEELLVEMLRPEDLLLTLGAGNVWHLGERILTRFGETNGS